MDAKCPECERVAILNDDVTSVKCPHCNFEADYDTYLEIMKDHAEHGFRLYSRSTWNVITNNCLYLNNLNGLHNLDKTYDMLACPPFCFHILDI